MAGFLGHGVLGGGPLSGTPSIAGTELQGSSTIVISTTGTLVDTNALQAASNIVISSSADLTIAARLQASATINVGTTGRLRGETTLTEQDIIDIVDAIFNRVVESGETFQDQLRLIRAEAAGELAVDGTEVSIKSANGARDRIVAETDVSGQRTSVTTDAT